MHTINYKHISVKVNPVGAELSSLKAGGREYIWHGDKHYWTGRAPILFPIVGALKNDVMTHDGRQYNMPRHGLARRLAFECIDQSTAEALSMKLTANDTTLQQYPWRFELQVHFKLQNSGLEIRYDILNLDNTDMLYTIGSHPAFLLQLSDTVSLSDYQLEFNREESLQRYQLTDDGLLEHTTRAFSLSDNTIRLSAKLFNDDALVFRNINSDRISLLCNGKTQLSVETGNSPHLGIWAKPGAPFVCIEPWFGTSDFTDASGNFVDKSDLTRLKPGQTLSHEMAIRLPQTKAE